MKRAQSFECMGRHIKIEYVKEIGQEDLNNGLCLPDKNLILIKQDLEPETMELTIWHEKFHMATCAIGRPDLSSDENFIEAISGIFHQIENTTKRR